MNDNDKYHSDFAKVFGCMIGLKDEVTAITLVTFGTSQIDLFASRIAAVNDPTADNSIGNVVAANAIGVFLGGTFFLRQQLAQGMSGRLTQVCLKV